MHNICKISPTRFRSSSNRREYAACNCCRCSTVVSTFFGACTNSASATSSSLISGVSVQCHCLCAMSTVIFDTITHSTLTVNSIEPAAIAQIALERGGVHLVMRACTMHGQLRLVGELPTALCASVELISVHFFRPLILLALQRLNSCATEMGHVLLEHLHRLEEGGVAVGAFELAIDRPDVHGSMLPVLRLVHARVRAVSAANAAVGV